MRAPLIILLAVAGCDAQLERADAHLASAVQAVVGANDAPVLDATKAPQLDPMLAAGAPSGAVGTPVSTLVDFATPAGQVDNVSDVDSTDGDGPALTGMAVIDADATHGTWWRTLDGGTSWQLLGAPTPTTAVLLDAASARVYFQPAADFGGPVPTAITFRAWDRTSGVSGGLADTTLNGGATSFSTAIDTASLNVVAISLRSTSAAGATGNPATLTINKPAGVASRDLLVASITVAPAGTVITAPAGWALVQRVDGTNNTLATYYHLGGPADPATYVWTLTGASAAAGGIEDYFNVDTAAPVDDWGGQATPSSLDHTTTPETATTSHSEVLTWHSYASAGTWTPPAGMSEAIDVNSEGTTGASGVSLEGANVPMLVGGLVAPRTATASNDADTGATVAVILRLTTINNAPVLDAAKSPALASEAEESPAPVGAVGSLVSSLVDAPGGGGLDNLYDIDPVPSGGIAVTAADTANGSWWYSTNNGATWLPLGAVSAASSRLLAADASTRIYFQPQPNFNGVVTAAITFRAWDRTSGANGSTASTTSTGGFFAYSIVTDTASITVTNVNDAPTATNLSAAETYTKNTPLDLIDIVASDIDSPNITATLTLSSSAAGSLSTGTSGTVTSTYVVGTGVWTASGPLADVNALLAGVTLTPATGSTASFSIATNISDGALSVSGTKAMTGVGSSSAPTATNLSAPEAYAEDTPLDLVDIVASDSDSSNLTATLTLSNSSAGSLSTSTSGGVTSTYVVGTGVWTASGAIAGVNALLAGVTFVPAANSSVSFTIATKVSDGTASVTGTKTVTGTAVNDAPMASNLSANEAYTEDTPVDLVDIVASDIDNANVTATLNLSDPSAGSLSTGASGSVTSTYVAITGVWTASGAIADVNVLLASVTLTPAANSSASFTIGTNVSDGTASVSGTKTVVGTAVDDAPMATNLSASESYTEDTPLDLVDIVASDIDSANVTATLTLSNASAGSLSTGTSGAVTSVYASGSGVWTASGAVADVDVLLAGVTLTPAANSSVSFTIATNVSDGTASVSGTKTVIGTAVDDAPIATNLSASEIYTENTPLDLVDIVASDIDSANVTATLTLSNATAGSLSTGTSGSVTSVYGIGTGVWTASGAIADVDVLLANVVFTPAPSSSANLTITTSVADATTAVTGAKALTGVSSIDGAPIAVDDAADIMAGATAVIDVAANDHDPDDGLDLASVTVAAAPAHGAVTVAANGNVTYAHDGSSSTSDTFTYTIRDAAGASSGAATVTVTITPALTMDDPKDSGCGCQSTGAGPTWPALVVAVLLGRRRRRSTGAARRRSRW